MYRINRRMGEKVQTVDQTTENGIAVPIERLAS